MGYEALVARFLVAMQQDRAREQPFFLISYAAELIKANKVLCFGNWLLTTVIGPLPALDHGLDVPAVGNPRKYSRIRPTGLGFGSAMISIMLV